MQCSQSAVAMESVVAKVEVAHKREGYLRLHSFVAVHGIAWALRAAHGVVLVQTRLSKACCDIQSCKVFAHVLSCSCICKSTYLACT